MQLLIDFPSECLFFIQIGPVNYYVRRKTDSSFIGEIHINSKYQYVYSAIDVTLTIDEISSILSFLNYLSRKDY